jgi:hypothetical protein
VTSIDRAPEWLGRWLRARTHWFIVPVTLPLGSITDVRGIVVTNVFGERTLVEAAGRGSDQD